MKRVVLALLSVSLLALSACAPPASSSGESPHIIVTTNILGDVVAAIVGPEARVTTLMKPNADPHSFEISAREAAQLNTASLQWVGARGRVISTPRSRRTRRSRGVCCQRFY